MAGGHAKSQRGLQVATIASATPVRVRARRVTVVVKPRRDAITTAQVRRDLTALGVPATLVDAAFVRNLQRASVELLQRASADEPALVERIGRDPVAAYRAVDPELAQQLGAVIDAVRAARVAPPDLGTLPEVRKPPRATRPAVRVQRVERAVAKAKHALLAWAAGDPEHAALLERDPSAAVAQGTGRTPAAVRALLLARLTRAPARKGSR
jgi:hypothetical protein